MVPRHKPELRKGGYHGEKDRDRGGPQAGARGGDLPLKKDSREREKVTFSELYDQKRLDRKKHRRTGKGSPRGRKTGKKANNMDLGKEN